jgi:hypothetical protein
MDQALIGLAGIVIGILLGGTGKYFTQRRDAWIQARASGLLILADVCALLDAQPDDPVVAGTELGVKTWESHRQTLAAFRKGTYPNGFKANEWLCLARHFAALETLNAKRPSSEEDGAWWVCAQREFVEAKRLLARFEKDPPVVRHAILNVFEKGE